MKTQCIGRVILDFAKKFNLHGVVFKYFHFTNMWSSATGRFGRSSAITVEI